MNTYLIISIDVEEEFDWGEGNYFSRGGTIENISELAGLQKTLCEIGAKVTYFVDFPVLNDKIASDVLKGFVEDYDAELGTHLHPWCTPPFEEALTEKHTMANMLPIELVRRKMENLTEKFIDTCGFQPVSYRAGRFGLDSASANVIYQLGYQIDSSVTPFCDWSKCYGPNFFSAPFRPYYMSPDHILSEKRYGELLEVPISVGFSRIPFYLWSKIFYFCRKSKVSRFKIIGLLSRAGIVKKVRLNPERQSVKEMKQLVKSLYSEKVHVFNMILHSSSLIPGGNSFIRDRNEVHVFKQRLETIVSWIIQEMKAEPIRLFDLLTIQQNMY